MVSSRSFSSSFCCFSSEICCWAVSSSTWWRVKQIRKNSMYQFYSGSGMCESSHTAAALQRFYLQSLQLWTRSDVLLQFTVECSWFLLDASSFHWAAGNTFQTLAEAGRTMTFISTLTFDSALVLSQFLCSLHKVLLEVQLTPADINTRVKLKVWW